MTKYILDPGPITIVDPRTDQAAEGLEPVTLGGFIRQSLLVDPRWTSDLTWLRSKSAVMRATKPSKIDHSHVELEAGDYEKLAQVARAPQGGYAGYAPIVYDQLLPFIEAVVDAKDKKPE